MGQTLPRQAAGFRVTTAGCGHRDQRVQAGPTNDVDAATPRQNQWVLRIFVTAALLAGCVGPPAAAPRCEVTPTSTRSINGFTLVGNAGGDIFLYGGGDRVLRTEASGGPEKLLVFIAKLPSPLPSSINLHGANLVTGTRRTFAAQHQESAYGTEWGSNFSFPDAGCWELTLRESGNEGRVVVEVK